MLEKFMIFSVVTNMLALFVILCLILIGLVYIFYEKMKDKRRDKIQKKLDSVIERGENDV